MRRLRQQGAISAQQSDTSDTNADVVAATVAADKAAVDMARLNLDYTQIRSPVDGKTGPILVQPGNMISSSSGADRGPGHHRGSAADQDFLHPAAERACRASRRASRARPLLATLDVQDTAGQVLAAPVDFTSNIVSNQSGTIELRATFPNTDLSLVPGQLVNVTVQLNDIPAALVVPRDAVNDSPNGSFVFVVKDGKADPDPGGGPDR